MVPFSPLGRLLMQISAQQDATKNGSPKRTPKHDVFGVHFGTLLDLLGHFSGVLGDFWIYLGAPCSCLVASWPQDPTREAQVSPKTIPRQARDGPKESQESPKKVPRQPKGDFWMYLGAPCPKRGPESPKTSQETVPGFTRHKKA